MTSIELPDDVAAVLVARAASQNLKLEDWLKQQAVADVAKPQQNNLDDLFAKVRGLAEDIDFSRNLSDSQPIKL